MSTAQATSTNYLPPTDAPILLFDGVCNLCNESVQWVIRHDPGAKFRFASLQSEAGSGTAPAARPTDR